MKKTMLICSTKHQVVNLAPALKENTDHLIIFTTGYAKRQKWTENLIPVLESRNIAYENIAVQRDIESDPGQFTQLIFNTISQEQSRGNKVILNIGGGQKIFAMAMMRAFTLSRDTDISIVYTEGNSRKIFHILPGMETGTTDYRINISLEEMLQLYGYVLHGDKSGDNVNITSKIDKEHFVKKYTPAKNASKYLRKSDLFQEVFYRSMMQEEKTSIDPGFVRDYVRKSISSLKLNFENLDIPFSTGHDPQTIQRKRKNLKKISDAKKLIDSAYAPHRYNSYWNAVKDRIIEHVAQNIVDLPTPVRIEDQYSSDEQNKLKEIFNNLGESASIEFEPDDNLFRKKVSFSTKNGDFFEQMVTSEVAKLRNKPVWKHIHQIWINVSTRRKDQDKKSGADAEYDLVIVTTFGTLIMLESKSAKFENKTAKGQERDALQKSGPYGRSIIIGPVLKDIKKLPDEKRREQYPYVAESLIDQVKKVEQAGMRYWCLDEITDNLERMLK